MKMTISQAIIFMAYIVATCIALVVFGTRDRGWGNADRLVYVVNASRYGDIPTIFPPGWPR